VPCGSSLGEGLVTDSGPVAAESTEPPIVSEVFWGKVAGPEAMPVLVPGGVGTDAHTGDGVVAGPAPESLATREGASAICEAHAFEGEVRPGCQPQRSGRAA
jgi:hypothetical protein